jgi:hypothetical protein
MMRTAMLVSAIGCTVGGCGDDQPASGKAATGGIDARFTSVRFKVARYGSTEASLQLEDPKTYEKTPPADYRSHPSRCSAPPRRGCRARDPSRTRPAGRASPC